MRIAELNTWRAARKHADPEPSRGGVATVRGRVIAACAAAGMGGERSYCNGIVATVAGRRENCESELNTWKSAAIFAPVLA